MTCVLVDFDCSTVVYGGWSPAELHQCAPQADVLVSRQPAVAIVETIAARLRPSMLFAPFETLRCFWNPLQQELPTAAEVLRSGGTCCMQVSWNNRSARPSASTDDMTEKGIWFRFVSTFQHRKYSFERSPKQLAVFLSVLQVSFPHLLVPVAKEPTLQVARALISFIENHAEELCAYLPLLYFFYEVDDRSVVNFFNLLEELVHRRQVNECNLNDALRPRESSWFGWNAPKPISGEINLSDDISFMDANADRLPQTLKTKFLFVRARMEALKRAQDAAVALREALIEDVEAFESTVELLGRSQGKLMRYGCEGWSTPSNLSTSSRGNGEEEEEEERKKQQYLQQNEDTRRYVVGDTDIQIVKEAIIEFMNVASVLRGQVFGPILTALVDSVRTSEVTADAQYRYLRSVLSCARIVIYNEPFITGAKDIPRSSQVAQNRLLLRQVSEHHGKMRQLLRAFKLHIDDELRISERVMHKSLLSCCTHCFQAFTTFYDAFEARHHTKLIPTGGRRDSPVHPLLQLFYNTEEEQCKEGDHTEDQSDM
ncbi:uncharacterized protein TM35_000162720 [Trypanosoma theileri]|uniref:Uncharacterized protein n=1 Tax=Trypanosoma theileri TaxID=67003 RepID=A0A1X0NVA2_9TRYP|nr:uncharacterized protein TM35_000162720 [Trypanosoma theileri]ORC88634.1 hypothetical protein TM35_000162720 [Trypanosoma theileri]